MMNGLVRQLAWILQQAALLPVVTLIAGGSRCQLPDGGWLMSTDHNYALYYDQSFIGLALDPIAGSGHLDGMGVDKDGFVYTTEFGVTRHFYLPAPFPNAGHLFRELPGAAYQSTHPYYPRGAHMSVNLDGVWLLEADGELLFVGFPVQNGAASTVRNDVRPVVHANGRITSVCSNGRDLYFGILSPNQHPEIWAIDLRAPQQPARYIATVASSLAYQLSLQLGRDDTILAMGMDGLYRIDLMTGQASLVEPVPANPAFVIPGGPQYQSEGPIRLAYDPWTDMAAIGPCWMVDVTIVYGRTVQGPGPFQLVYAFGWFSGLRKLVSASRRPFEAFGTGCQNGFGREPRIGWQGLPRQGQSFTLKLRDAEPNTLAILWLGWSDSFWGPVGALPYDAAPYGAPGCRLLVAPDGPVPFVTDSAGRANYTINVPQHPVIHGMQVFAQSVSVSGANAFGFGTSDAVAIRMR